MALTIPTHIATALNSELVMPESYSHIYLTEDLFPVSLGTKYFKFPYSKNITWTNFRISWIGPHSPQVTLTFGKDAGELNLASYPLTRQKWQDLYWVLPSHPFPNEDEGFYLKIDYPELPITSMSYLKLYMLGFENILPYFKNEYIFVDENDNSKFGMEVPSEINCPAKFSRLSGTHLERGHRFFIRPSSTLLDQ